MTVATTYFSVKNSDPTNNTVIVQNTDGTTALGIGTNTPAYTLDITGTASISGAFTHGGTFTTTKLVLTTASARIVPGATSLSLRNSADSRDNLIVTDAGVVTIAPSSATGTNGGSIALGQTTNTTTIPDNTTSVNFLRVMANFAGTSNAPNGNSGRAVYSESHYSDNTNGLATLAGGYFQTYHDGTGSTITDHFGLIGRAYVTSTGTATNMWGARGDVQFTGAGTATDVMSLWGRFPTQTAGATLTNWYGLRVDQINFSTMTATNAYGALIGVPASAVGHKIGAWIGPLLDTGTTYTVGLACMASGAWVKGIPTLAPPADTGTTQAVLALCAGSNSGTNNVNALLYFYRNQTNQGYVGFTSNTSNVIAGHTKVVGDLALHADSKLLIDTNGQIWADGKISASTGLQNIQTVSTSANPAPNITLTSGAHTTLVNTEVIAAQFNFSSTVQFTGSTTLATQRSFVVQAPTFTSDTATKAITAATTMAITGPPIASTNVTVTAPNTSILWLGSGVATVAGGALAAAIAIGATASVPTAGIYWGSGAPSITAPQGSLYIRTDGSSTSTRLYVNTTGSTTWTNVTTAA